MAGKSMHLVLDFVVEEPTCRVRQKCAKVCFVELGISGALILKMMKLSST